MSYRYDNNGNQTSRGSDSFSWDAEDRLTSATVSSTTTTFAYNGDGLRDSLTQGSTTTFTWDVGVSIPQVLDDGTFKYIYGLGRIAEVGPGTTTHYYLPDGLGSTMALVDSSGSAVNTYDYDVFGAIRASSGSQANEFKFTGEQVDASTGLQYLRARYYDSAMGRFTSKDPFGGYTEMPLSQHRYVYVHNNPASLTDPMGLDPCTLMGRHRICVPDPLGLVKETVSAVTGGSVSSSVQRADLLPWGVIPFANVAATALSWPLDVAAFGFATSDVLSSSCTAEEKRGMMAFNTLNLLGGLGGQLLASASSPSVVGPFIIQGTTTVWETTFYVLNEMKLHECKHRVSEVKGVNITTQKE